MKKTTTKQAQQACQVWPLLVWAARHHQILFYEEVADLVGTGPRQIGDILDPIYAYCKDRKNMPPLTAIVVRQDTGQPGSGMPKNIFRKIREVFQHKFTKKDYREFVKFVEKKYPAE